MATLPNIRQNQGAKRDEPIPSSKRLQKLSDGEQQNSNNKRSKKQRDAAEAYKNELAAKSRARAAAIAAAKKAEEDERRRLIEEQEELERQRLEEIRLREEEEARERERMRKLEEERLEQLRIQELIENARETIEKACAVAIASNKRWPNRELDPAPHSTLRRVHTETLDLLDENLPKEENHQRSFMVACTKLIYRLEVESYPQVKNLVKGREDIYTDASLRFQAWFEQQTQAGRFVTYEPPPYDPRAGKKQKVTLDEEGAAERGTWKCNICQRMNDATYGSCVVCGIRDDYDISFANRAKFGYDIRTIEAMKDKTKKLIAAKVPAKERLKRGIHFWLHGNRSDGHDYEDYML